MSKEFDELSAALDQLNIGQAPQSPAEELTELLEVAALLRKSDLPVRPPEHILTDIIARAAADENFDKEDGIQAQLRSGENITVSKKPRRLIWVYSGVLGAAAALLIFVGIHGFPEIQEVSKQVSSTAVRTAAPETPPAPTPAAVSATTTAPSAVAVVPAAPAPSPAAPIAPVPPAAQPTARLAAPATAPTVAEKSARQSPASGSSLNSNRYSSSAGEKPSPPSLVALHLPGRQADSVLRDPSTGCIRQVFGQGTDAELILTQRNLPTTEKGVAPRTEPQATPETAKTNKAGTISLNKITIVIHGQQVTLEGPQSLEELRKLAQSLSLP